MRNMFPSALIASGIFKYSDNGFDIMRLYNAKSTIKTERLKYTCMRLAFCATKSLDWVRVKAKFPIPRVHKNAEIPMQYYHCHQCAQSRSFEHDENEEK